MGGETAADDSTEEDGDASLFEWVSVMRIGDTSDSGDQPTDDQAEGNRTGAPMDSPNENDPETVDLEALIDEDPADETHREANATTETADPGEDRDPQRNAEAGPEPPTDGKPDRLWNRFGGDEPDRSGEDTSDQGATERGRRRDTDRSEETAENPTEAGTTDDDRLWDSDEPGPAESDESTPTALEQGGETAPSTGSDRTAPTGGDEAPEQGTRFDHLLERSGSGSGNSRPVGSPSVETDLDAFFDDLDEFDRATSGSQVLVISPRGHSITDEVCSHFLTAGGVSGRNAMFVTAVESPSERVDIYRNCDDGTGGKVAVIELGDTGSDSDEALGSLGGEEVIHKRVNSPKNLSKTGLLITQTLKKWSNSDQPSVLCFHTLTAISGYVENETLFQFLFTLQAKLNSFGVTGHYHMDANRHDQQEINTLKTLFDLVVTITQNGEIEVE